MCEIPNNDMVHSNREEMLKRVEDATLQIISVIEAFNGEVLNPINYNDLELFEIGQWVNLNDKVKIRRRKNRFNNYLNFDTEIKEGGEFGKHFHGDIIESCEVLTGELLDVVDGTHYYPGDIAHYEKSVRHMPIALKDTKLHVLFKP